MPRRLVQPRPAPEEHDELAFPVPYAEQSKYLQLADHYLALEVNTDSNIVSIDASMRIEKRGLKDAA